MIRFTLTILLISLFQLSFGWNTPVMNSPSNGSTTWSGVTLDWYAVSGSQKYQMQLDTTPNFNSPVLRIVTENYVNSSSSNWDTDEYCDNLFFGVNYFWRVRAWIPGDTSLWSATWNFTTRDYVNLDGPSNGSTTWAGVTLDWFSHHGVDFYDLEADTSLLFDSPAKKAFSKSYVNSNSSNWDTEHFLDDIYFGSTYYWRVRARNTVDTCEWSSVWTIHVRDYVNLDGPSNGSTTWAGVTLDWFSHPGVNYYDMQADTVPTFNSQAIESATKSYINSNSSNSDTEHFLDDIYFGEKYYWRVRARNAVDTSEWSEVRYINIRDYVSLNYPADGSTNVSTGGITLDWYAHSGVNYYQLQYDTTNEFNSVNFVQSTKTYINSNSNNSDTRHSTGYLKPNTIYVWRVRAINVADTTSWTTWAFNTGSDPVIFPDTPALLFPIDSAVKQSVKPTLDWEDISNADRYIIQYDLSGLFNNPMTAESMISQIQVFNLLYEQTYYWRVRTVINGLVSDWSETRSFTTGLGTPALIYPANDSADVPVYNLGLGWSAVDHADGYLVEYSPDSTFTSGVVSVSPINSDTILSNLLYETPYFWRVRAFEDSFWGGWSDTLRFVTRENPHQVFVNLKVILQGPFFFTEMLPFLTFYNLIPQSQPYNAPPWNYNGPEYVGAIPNANVVDWILVELRESSGGPETALPDSIAGIRAGFLLRDGSIVDLDGESPLTFDLSLANNIYAVVRHRNHIAVMSNDPLVFQDGIYVCDFTTDVYQAFGGQNGHSEIEPGIWGMTAGDGNQDGQVSNPDKNSTWKPILGTQGYLNGDFNINGFADYPDKTNYWEKNAGKAGCVPGD